MGRDSGSDSVGLAAFRRLFPGLSHVVYLNTPGCAPGARPVTRALHRALEDWESGSFSTLSWERDALKTRALFARLIGAEGGLVALLSSASEGAATVARSLPPGKVVVGEREFRSNLFPWLSLKGEGRDVVVVPATDRGEVPTEVLLDAVDDRTALVAISSVQFASGFRARLTEITERTKETGARLFLDITQHVGALRFDVGEILPDYAVAHGYKWLLCPRGAAWLYVAPEHLAEIVPLVPSWRSAPEPHARMEGGPLEYASDARKLDASLALLPWVGAHAALETLLALDTGEVERQCIRLVSDFREGAEERGFGLSPIEEPSQVVGVSVENTKAVVDHLARRHVMVGARGRYVRLGFHAFNNEADVGAALDALSDAL